MMAKSMKLLLSSVIIVYFLFSTPVMAVSDEGNILRLALNAMEPGTLDPHFSASTQDRAIADMIFNGLLRYKPGNAPIIEPDLAETFPKVEMIEGQQIWTFTLRRGVMFHPGPLTKSYELTADDVVFSLRKSADPAYSAYAGEYTGMIVEKVNRYTIRIILEEPLSESLFLPKVTDYAGGGPFMFGSYVVKEKIRLEANKRYFRGSPFLDAVEVLFMPGLAERERGLTSGRVDCICGKIDDAWLQNIMCTGGLTR
jgi:peptide/nickel transport system substrate-binding protein